MRTGIQDIPIEAYNYPLPPEKIADFPLARRDASRLLVYRNGTITDDQFTSLPNHLSQATLVLNNTRVIQARIFFQKPTGGQIEVFCLGPHEQSIEAAMQQKQKARWQCLIGGASKWKSGQVLEKNITVEEQNVTLQAVYIEKREDYFIIEFSWEPGDLPFSLVIQAAGNIPLPPYIKRKTTDADAERYQTIFGVQEGSVAAPTAALHFTPAVFAALQEKNVHPRFITLHVGAGTFKPVKSATIGEHQMHSEPFSVNRSLIENLISAKQIVAVGTTSLRTLESLYWCGVKLLKQPDANFLVLSQWEAYELEEKFPDVPVKESLEAILKWMDAEARQEIHCSTGMIIVPGYAFKIPQVLITNFHQPQSTLLLLVSAFIGEDWRKVYDHALSQGYRFLSYGDSSLLFRNS